MKKELKFILDMFGIENQFNKTLEELSELSTKIYHYRDNKCNVIELIDEIVDVDIMISQLIIFFEKERNIDIKTISKNYKYISNGIEYDYKYLLKYSSILSGNIYKFLSNEYDIDNLYYYILLLKEVLYSLKKHFDEKILDVYKKGKIERTLRRIESGYYGVKDGE